VIAKKKKRKNDIQKSKRKNFSFWKLLWNLKVEIGIVLCVLIGVRLIYSSGKDNNLTKKITPDVSKLSKDRHNEWKKKYPSGYKIIVFVDNYVLHTQQDTLPEDLKIDWNNVSRLRTPSDLTQKTEAKIKITIPIMSYAPAEIFNLKVSTTIYRNQKKSWKVAALSWHNLFIEIIEDNGEEIFCLLGFQ